MSLQLRRFLKPKTEARQGIVAVSFFANGFAIAVTRYSSNNRPRLQFCDFITAPQNHWQNQLETLVKTQKLDQFSCHILLSLDQYRSFSIEAPQVHPEELKQAVQWRIAENLDYPIEQAIFDFYPQPKSNRANRAAMLEVFSCKKATITPLIDICRQAGLQIKVIDIQEAALRNLASLLPENQQGLAILHLQSTIGHVIIEKQSNIYLSRKFDFNYHSLSQTNFEANEDSHLEHNNLALELQRSLDYVENYFDIPPINSLAAVLLPNNTQDIINGLIIRHGITARAMDLTAILDVEMPLSDGLQNQCAPVVGASLRWHVEQAA